MAQSTTKTTRKPSSPATKAADKNALPKTRSKSAAKPKPAPEAAALDAVVVEDITPVTVAEVLKKPELIDMIVERSGVKKRDVKPALDAALQILGEVLADGREMNLPPLGKVRLNRMKQLSNARVLNCKIRQPTKTEEDGDTPLADAAE